MVGPTTARDVRAFTRRAGADNQSSAERRGFGDFYSYALMAVLGIIEAIGLVSTPERLNGTLGATATTLQSHVADQAPALLLLALIAWLYSVARGIGPVVITRAQVAWWLPLPIARRGLILPGFVFSLLTAVLLLGVGALVVAIGLGVFAGQGGAVAAVSMVVAVVALGVLVFGIAALVQIRGMPTPKADAAVRWLVPAALSVVVVAQALASVLGRALVPLDWAAWLPTGWPIAAAGLAAWPAAVMLVVVLLAAASILLLIVVLLLPRLSSQGLRRSAAAVGDISASLLSMQTPQAPSIEKAEDGRQQRMRRHRGIRRPHVVGPSGRFIVTQAHAWLRIPGHLARLATSALVPTVLVLIPALNLRVVVLIVLLICAFRAVSVASVLVRVIADNPALERLFALSDARQRQLLIVVPAVLLLLWSCGCFALLTLIGAASAWWALLALPVGLGLGGASVRSGFRPAPDWSAPSISTPAGALPTGWIYSAMYGRAAVVIVLLPAAIALTVGVVTPVVIVAQIVISSGVMWWGTRVRSAVGGLQKLNPWAT